MAGGKECKDVDSMSAAEMRKALKAGEEIIACEGREGNSNQRGSELSRSQKQLLSNMYEAALQNITSDKGRYPYKMDGIKNAVSNGVLYTRPSATNFNPKNIEGGVEQVQEIFGQSLQSIYREEGQLNTGNAGKIMIRIRQKQTELGVGPTVELNEPSSGKFAYNHATDAPLQILPVQAALQTGRRSVA